MKAAMWQDTMKTIREIEKLNIDIRMKQQAIEMEMAKFLQNEKKMTAEMQDRQLRREETALYHQDLIDVRKQTNATTRYLGELTEGGRNYRAEMSDATKRFLFEQGNLYDMNKQERTAYYKSLSNEQMADLRLRNAQVTTDQVYGWKANLLDQELENELKVRGVEHRYDTEKMNLQQVLDIGKELTVEDARQLGREKIVQLKGELDAAEQKRDLDAREKRLNTTLAGALEQIDARGEQERLNIGARGEQARETLRLEYDLKEVFADERFKDDVQIQEATHLMNMDRDAQRIALQGANAKELKIMDQTFMDAQQRLRLKARKDEKDRDIEARVNIARMNINARKEMLYERLTHDLNMQIDKFSFEKWRTQYVTDARKAIADARTKGWKEHDELRVRETWMKATNNPKALTVPIDQLDTVMPKPGNKSGILDLSRRYKQSTEMVATIAYNIARQNADFLVQLKGFTSSGASPDPATIAGNLPPSYVNGERVPGSLVFTNIVSAVTERLEGDPDVRVIGQEIFNEFKAAYPELDLVSTPGLFSNMSGEPEPTATPEPSGSFLPWPFGGGR